MSELLSQLVLPAPAKLNLFLHITKRRDDGYHELQTVFQLLDHSDEIQLSIRSDGKITRHKDSDAEIHSISYESDLCVRAALLLRDKTRASHKGIELNKNIGVDIKLKKILPIGGGIGGGSSNAATVLCGLNTLWNCQFTLDELADFGAQLGADVPVFVRGYSSWAEGIGEQLIPITLEQNWFVVIHPKIFVSTAEIFADQALTRDCDSFTISRFLTGNESEHFCNVFESVVIKKYPEIAKAIDWLSSYSPAKLTGTGSCIFAEFKSEECAKKVLDALTKSTHNWSAFYAQGVNESSLRSALQK